MENLLIAWQEFLKGKSRRDDVAEFSLNLMDNIFDLHNELKCKTYKHAGYEEFHISDPKPRQIHKATVRDRLLHHAIQRVLYPYFDRKFIHDSYSSRMYKGTHKAISRFQIYVRKVSKNYSRTAWILKGDIRKFFASIDHDTLKEILRNHIRDLDIIWLLDEVIDSFHPERVGVGLPLGNLTSQLLANIFMNEFDQYLKRELKVRYYIRYADDFVIIHSDRDFLLSILPKLLQFLQEKLKLELHPNKVFIKTFGFGVDFLGWVHFPHHQVLRTVTKRRMLKKLRNPSKEMVESYFGLLNHGSTYKIAQSIRLKLLLMGYGGNINDLKQKVNSK